jgi:SWI/SNF-related matrix-associated actin-dependent regulator of chromatin subfamily A3
MDRRALGIGDLIEPPAPTELTQVPIPAEDEMDEAIDLRTGSSSKIDQLLHFLRLTPENEKSLVFSQFTTFLDKVSSVAWIAHTNNLPEIDRRRP